MKATFDNSLGVRPIFAEVLKESPQKSPQIKIFVGCKNCKQQNKTLFSLKKPPQKQL